MPIDVEESEYVDLEELSLEKVDQNWEKIVKTVFLYSGELEGYPLNKEKFYEGKTLLKNLLEQGDNWTIQKDSVKLITMHILMKDFLLSREKESLKLSEKIAKSFGQEGWLNKEKQDFNCQVYGAVLLSSLSKVTGIPSYHEQGRQYIQTLLENMDSFDYKTGLKKNGRIKRELEFCFVNPYSSTQISPLAIDEITLKEAINQEELNIDIGGASDEVFISGVWGNREEMDGRSIRRLSNKSVFRFTLPETWNDKKVEELELEIKYYDDEAANIEVRIQSETTKDGYRALRDGDLLIRGLGDWYSWKLPIRGAEAGEEMNDQQLKTASVLLQLSAEVFKEVKAEKWSKVIDGYCSLWSQKELPNVIKAQPVVYPTQTTPLAFQIKDGLLAQRLAGEETIMINGIWDGKSPAGELAMSPYVIASQARGMISNWESVNEEFDIETRDYEGIPWADVEGIKKLKRETALEWLDNHKKQVGENAFVWQSNVRNAYNDIITEAPWASAFFQRHIIEAYLENNKVDMAVKAGNAFLYSIEEGGLTSSYWKKGKWYEEVPEKTHILNAHLASIMALNKVWEFTGEEGIKDLMEEGIESLEWHIADYDGGYWTIYDRNPRQDVMLQIDWLEGEEHSILIDEICLVNVETNNATSVDVGTERDFSSYPYISGGDWGGAKVVDGRTVRTLLNGYFLRDESERQDGETRQNTYCLLALPEQKYEDFFDVPIHKVIVTYKDVGKGTFMLKQSSKNRSDILKFEPLKGGEIICVGDGKWKTKEILLFPSDLGWWMGYKYHQYHQDELGRIAELSDSWYFRQYSEKWSYYLESWEKGESPIKIEENVKVREIDTSIEVTKDIKAEDGYGIENCLDGEWTDNYAVSNTDRFPQDFEISLQEDSSLDYIVLIWESIDNYGVKYKVEGVTSQGNTILLGDERNGSGMEQIMKIDSQAKIKKLKFTIFKTEGVPKVAIREVRLLEEIR